MKTKPFDCVAMKEQGATQVQEQLVGLTPTQILAFWQERTKILRQQQEQLRQAQQTQRDFTAMRAAKLP